MAKISTNFLRLYWGAVLGDIEKNLEILVWNNIKFNLKAMDKEAIHRLFKIITFNNKSLAEMSSKDVVKYLEDIRVILADNGYSLKIDNEEFERLLQNAKEKIK